MKISHAAHKYNSLFYHITRNFTISTSVVVRAHHPLHDLYLLILIFRFGLLAKKYKREVFFVGAGGREGCVGQSIRRTSNTFYPSVGPTYFHLEATNVHLWRDNCLIEM